MHIERPVRSQIRRDHPIFGTHVRISELHIPPRLFPDDVTQICPRVRPRRAPRRVSGLSVGVHMRHNAKGPLLEQRAERFRCGHKRRCERSQRGGPRRLIGVGSGQERHPAGPAAHRERPDGASFLRLPDHVIRHVRVFIQPGVRAQYRFQVHCFPSTSGSAVMNVCFATSECVPFVKTGGLADVAGALPVALSRARPDIRIKVFLPLYARIPVFDHGFVHADDLGELNVTLGDEPVPYHVWYGHLPDSEVEVYLIDCPRFFHRGTLYTDHVDEARRFILLQKAAFDVMQRYAFSPDIVHSNDWQTALMPAMLRHAYAWDERFRQARSVLSIHNLAYQGLTHPHYAWEAGLPVDHAVPGGAYHMDGAFSCLRAGLVEADQITTVSPTYAAEIQTPLLGCGLDGVLSARHNDLTGILNGVDTAYWNPRTDAHLAAHYGAGDLGGKAACRTALLAEFGLSAPPDVPVIGIVSRLADQKGFDLLVPELEQVLREREFRLIVLGSGAPWLEGFFRSLAAIFPDKVGLFVGYDEGLSHRIEAGADAFLMPSHYEPCGLNQMYSMLYGTLPIVHHTGGLADTVRDLDEHPDQGTGFSFHDARPDVVAATLHRAIDTFQDQDIWRAAMRRAMQQDFSWDRAAASYLNVYQRALSQRP